MIDNFDTAPPSLSHGDLVFDPRSDLFQGGGDDAEHPTVITMSRVRLASDTCDLFSYIKVNLLLYTCSLDPFEDGVLLDTSPMCMHRYYWSFMDVKEEGKRQGTPTPSAREAWKRRWKKRSCYNLQPPDDRTTPDVRHLELQPAQESSRQDLQRPNDRPIGRPTPPRPRTTERHRTTGATATE